MLAPDRKNDAVSSAVVERRVREQREALQQRLDRLVAACRDCMQETASADPPLQAILTRARVPLASFYRLFATKDELVLAVMERGTAETLTELERAMEAVSVDARIDTWVEAVVVHATSQATNGATSLFGRQANLLTTFPAESDALIDRLCKPLAVAIADQRGHRRRSSADARLIYWMVCGFIAERTLGNRAMQHADLAGLQSAARRIASPPPARRAKRG